MKYDNDIRRSEKSYKEIYNFMIEFDNIYKKKYEDCDITPYFRIIKEKKNIKKYAYALQLFNNNDMPLIINLFFSLKNTKPKYDIICFVNDKDYYEKDYLNNLYLKFNRITKENIKIIKKLFDCVIHTPIIQVYSNNEKIHLYDMYYKFAYTKYSKILFIELICLVNKNIDFLFEKYDKSTYFMPKSHRKYSGGLLPTITLVNTNKYYIEKIKYLNLNYDDIFNELYFFIPIQQNIIFYTIFPNWSETPFDIDIVNFIYSDTPNINIKYPIKDDYYIDYYFSKSPNILGSFDNFDILEKTKFELFIINYKKWDENVKKILEKYPEYTKFFEYIKTYRDTLF